MKERINAKVIIGDDVSSSWAKINAAIFFKSALKIIQNTPFYSVFCMIFSPTIAAFISSRQLTLRKDETIKYQFKLILFLPKSLYFKSNIPDIILKIECFKQKNNSPKIDTLLFHLSLRKLEL